MALQPGGRQLLAGRQAGAGWPAQARNRARALDAQNPQPSALAHRWGPAEATAATQAAAISRKTRRLACKSPHSTLPTVQAKQLRNASLLLTCMSQGGHVWQRSPSSLPLLLASAGWMNCVANDDKPCDTNVKSSNAFHSADRPWAAALLRGTQNCATSRFVRLHLVRAHSAWAILQCCLRQPRADWLMLAMPTVRP